MNALDRPAFYRIQWEGQLSPRWLAYFSAYQVQIETAPDGSDRLVLSGLFQDQAALMGALQTLYNLGCSLVSVERRPSR